MERVRENLHIAFTFPDIGDLFKQRLLTYPALNSYCTVVWFADWPSDAQQYIAKKFMTNTNLTTGKVTDISTKIETDPVNSDENEQIDSIKLTGLQMKLVETTLYFHKTIQETSEKFYTELNRKCYIMPLSFLEMLRLFQELYVQKFSEITTQRDR